MSNQIIYPTLKDITNDSPLNRLWKWIKYSFCPSCDVDKTVDIVTRRVNYNLGWKCKGQFFSSMCYDENQVQTILTLYVNLVLKKDNPLPQYVPYSKTDKEDAKRNYEIIKALSERSGIPYKRIFPVMENLYYSVKDGSGASSVILYPRTYAENKKDLEQLPPEMAEKSFDEMLKKEAGSIFSGITDILKWAIIGGGVVVGGVALWQLTNVKKIFVK